MLIEREVTGQNLQHDQASTCAKRQFRTYAHGVGSLTNDFSLSLSLSIYIYIYTEHSFLIRGRSVPQVLFGGLFISNSRAGLVGFPL